MELKCCIFFYVDLFFTNLPSSNYLKQNFYLTVVYWCYVRIALINAYDYNKALVLMVISYFKTQSVLKVIIEQKYDQVGLQYLLVLSL